MNISGNISWSWLGDSSTTLSPREKFDSHLKAKLTNLYVWTCQFMICIMPKGIQILWIFFGKKGKEILKLILFSLLWTCGISLFFILCIPVSSKYCLHCCTDTRIRCLSTKIMQQWLLSYTWGCKECIVTYNGGIPTVGRIAGLYQRRDDIVFWLWRQCTSTFSCSWWGY